MLRMNKSDALISIISKALLDDDNDSWESSEYCVKRFSTNAFDSSYNCFKVVSKTELVLSGKLMPESFVVKKTDQWEYEVLSYLHQNSISVPETYIRLVNKRVPTSTTILLFEEFCEGKDIWEVDDVEPWKELGLQTAKFHNIFLNKRILKISDVTSKRIHGAQIACSEDSRFRLTWIEAMNRLKNMPATLIHGDLFATNAVCTDRGVVIVDWADSGDGAFAMDLGRFTATINQKTSAPFCKYPNEFLESYYAGMQSVRPCDYSEFIKDVYAGQFMEVASYYDPSVLREDIWDDETVSFAVACRNKMEEIAKVLKA